MKISNCITIVMVLGLVAILCINPQKSNNPSSSTIVLDESTNTFTPDYKDGEILLPDYVHTDTLIVTDADRINYLFIKSQPATDGEISEALGEGTRIK